ncbi:MAG: hypothetical protein ACXVXC_10915 [Nocardioidaceae bacterium]
MELTDLSLLAVNRVPAAKAHDFEEFLRMRLLPATRKARPELTTRWCAYSAGTEDGIAVYVFAFEGGTPEDWHLEPILKDALGADEAGRILAEMDELLVEEQLGWELTPLDL